MSAYVLVHGGVHGAWCWDPVVERLTEHGHHVSAVELPGRGASADRAATRPSA